MLFEFAETSSDEVAIDDLTRRRTWAEFAECVVKMSRLIREHYDVFPGGHIAVLMDNRVEYVETVLGAVLAGVWVTPVNWHLSEEEIRYILSDSGCELCLTDSNYASLIESAGVRSVSVDSELEEATRLLGGEPLPLDGPAGGTMIYTSGTTGRPKGVQRAAAPTVRDALAGFSKSGKAIGLDGTGVHLVTGPLYHAAPLLFAVYDQASGASMVIMPKWDEAHAVRLIAERSVRHVHFVPTMFVRLLRDQEQHERDGDFSSLDLVLHGAAPISPEVKRQMIDWWGPILVEYWGGTEGGVTTLIDSNQWLEHPGSVGRCLDHFEVFATNDEGERLGVGEEGVLFAKNKNVERPFVYFGEEKKTAEAYLPDGSFTIGDVGYVDGDGFVFLADRKSNMIISGGVNIYPAEIERVLQQHPSVADVAVFGIPDAEWGEAVKAAVELVTDCVPSDDLEGEILQFASRQLARYKVPRSIDFEKELPRYPTGKLYTRLLRDRYWQGRTKQI